MSTLTFVFDMILSFFHFHSSIQGETNMDHSNQKQGQNLCTLAFHFEAGRRGIVQTVDNV